MKEIWGVFDTVDNIWIGDDDGPILFTGRLAEKLAKAAGFIVDMRLNQRRGITVEKLYTLNEPLPVVKRVRTAEDSIKLLSNNRQFIEASHV